MALSRYAWDCCITISFCLGIPEPPIRDIGLLQFYAFLYPYAHVYKIRCRRRPRPYEAERCSYEARLKPLRSGSLHLRNAPAVLRTLTKTTMTGTPMLPLREGVASQGVLRGSTKLIEAFSLYKPLCYKDKWRHLLPLGEVGWGQLTTLSESKLIQTINT